MRHLHTFGYFIFAMIFLISACGNSNNNSTNETAIAKEHGEDFIEALYTIDDPSLAVNDAETLREMQEEFSAYFTEDEFEDLRVKRFFVIPQEVANKEDVTISVHDINLEANERDDSESDVTDFEHSFTLLLINEEGEEEEKEITGQMTVIDKEDEPKIDRYYDTSIRNLLN